MKLWTNEELLRHHFVERHLIEPIVPADGIIFLYAKRNIGKTQLVMTITTCLANGGWLFGKYPAKPCSVLYVQADMPAPMQQERIQYLARQYQLPNVKHFFPRRLNLPEMVPSDETVQQIRDFNPTLIVWDTLRKVHRLGSNDDDTPSQVYGAAQYLFPGATHFFVHHDKKTIVDQAELDDEELFRGSGAWLDDGDTGLHLSKLAEGRLLLRFTKVRTAPPQEEIPLTLNPGTLLLYAPAQGLQPLAEEWRRRHPSISRKELERFLMSSFVGTPRAVQSYLDGRGVHTTPLVAPDLQVLK